METHLSSDLDFEQTFFHTSCVPVHLVLGGDVVTFDECVRISRIYYKTLGDDNWTRARFQCVAKDIMLEDFIKNTSFRIFKRHDACNVSDGKTRLQRAVFTTIGMKYDDNVSVYTDVVRIRIVCRPFVDREIRYGSWAARDRYAVVTGRGEIEVLAEDKTFDGEETVIDVDVMYKDLLIVRQRAPSGATDNAACGGRVAVSTTCRGSNVSGAVNDSAGDEETVSPVDSSFFNIKASSEIPPSIESYLAKFMNCKTRSMSDTGPLEGPSKVRGRVLTERRGKAFEEPVQSDAKDDTSESSVQKWFGYDNTVFISRIADIRRRKSLYTVWYSQSFWSSWNVPHRTIGDVTMRTALGRSFADFADCLSILCRNVCACFENVVLTSRILSQKISCGVSANVDFRPIFDLMCVSKHVWVTHVSERSCIIKALIEQLRDADAGRSAQYSGRGSSAADCWADVIDCVRGKVYPGIDVKLDVCARTGLLIPVVKDGHPARWARDPRLCVLYVRKDLNALWCVPGGFGAEFAIRLDGVQLGVIRDRFKMS